MKLEPKAKPVRIRIKSGGEEHFNLESLKRSFSVNDLWEAVIGKSLSRWLRQQEEKELADKVDGFCKIEKPSVDDYVLFSNLFFANETIVDADSLLMFYQNKALKKNFKNAFLDLFDSLSFEIGKNYFNSFKHLKKNEEWIDFFEQRIDELENMQAVDCHDLLSSLYKERGDFREMTFHQKKSSEQLGHLAKTDEKLLERLLSTGDYQTIKSIYENLETQNKVEATEWIEVFRKFTTPNDSQLSDQDKGECLYILYNLYDNVQNKEMARMALNTSAKLGYKKAIIELQSYSLKYPKLASIFQSYQHKITIDQLSQIASQIWYLVMKYKDQKHYENCFNCINMFLEIQSKHNYNTIQKAMDRRAQEIIQPNAEIPLVFLVAGLAWEEKYFNTILYRHDGGIQLPPEYQTIVKAKAENKRMVITTKSGLKCDTVTDSPIMQMIFFMISYSESYEFKNL